MSEPEPQVEQNPLVELVETKGSDTQAGRISTGSTTGGSITGLRVAVTRSADRAGGLADALAAAGAIPVMVPLIDFEEADGGALSASLQKLHAGEFEWLVVSSITTVRALKQWCAGAGISLPDLVPTTTRIATIGPTSVAALEGEGMHADLAPADKQSAEGLVELWPGIDGEAGSRQARPADSARPTKKVLIPQSNLASPTLALEIANKGWEVETVTAYKTVDYPAQEDKRLRAVLASSHGPAGAPYRQLTPAQAGQELRAGLIDGVVLASGSAARRVQETMAPLPERTLLVAIGEPTAAEAARIGLHVGATAAHPTPSGIVAALVQARLDASANFPSK